MVGWFISAALMLAASAPLPAAASPPRPCPAAGGQRWSAVRDVCVRLERAAIKLPRKSAAGPPAFVVFGTDEHTGRAELFMPDRLRGMMMRPVKDDGAGTWKAGSYTLTQWRGMYSLDNARGRTIYQGPAAP